MTATPTFKLSDCECVAGVALDSRWDALGCFAPTEPPLGGVSVAFGTSLRLRSRTVSVVEVPSRSDALARFFALTGPTLLGLVAAARVGSSRWAALAVLHAGLSTSWPWREPV